MYSICFDVWAAVTAADGAKTTGGGCGLPLPGDFKRSEEEASETRGASERFAPADEGPDPVAIKLHNEVRQVDGAALVPLLASRIKMATESNLEPKNVDLGPRINLAFDTKPTRLTHLFRRLLHMNT